MQEHRERKYAHGCSEDWSGSWSLAKIGSQIQSAARISLAIFQAGIPKNLFGKKTHNYNKQHKNKNTWVASFGSKSPQDLFVKGIFFSSSRDAPCLDTMMTWTASHEGAVQRPNNEGQGEKASNEAAFHWGPKKPTVELRLRSFIHVYSIISRVFVPPKLMGHVSKKLHWWDFCFIHFMMEFHWQNVQPQNWWEVLRLLLEICWEIIQN